MEYELKFKVDARFYIVRFICNCFRFIEIIEVWVIVIIYPDDLTIRKSLGLSDLSGDTIIFMTKANRARWITPFEQS